MDLRTIMNSDSAGVPSKPPQAQPPPSPLQPRTREPSPRRASYPNETSPPVHPSHPTEPRVRPPPPPPLQPPLHSPGRSSSYGSAQSPYQHSSASSILSGIPPPPNAPSYSQGSQSFLPVARDSFAATSAPLPHPTSSLCSPFTPQPLSSGTQQTYFSQARSHSIHSVTTPSSVRSFSFPAPREEAGTAQHAELPQSLPYSPNQAGSQPATPLGPPSASLKRPSPHPTRPTSSGLDADHAPLTSPWDRPDQQREQKESVSPILQSQISRQRSSLADQLHKQHLLERDVDRQRTSVSPKTVLGKSGHTAGDLGRVQDRSLQVHSNNEPDRLSWQTTSTTTNNPAPPHESDPTSQSLYPPTTPKTSHPSNSSHPSTVSPTSKQQFRRETDLSFQHQDIPMKVTDQPAPPSVASSFVPRKKRKRYHEPPIYAQKAPRTTGTPPAIPTRYKAGSSFPFKPPFPKRENPDDRPVSRNRSMPPRQAPTPQSTRSDVNGNAARSSTAGDSTSSLGPWEPSITGVIPHEEVTKLICDFLFQQVVMRKDIGAGPAGGSATGSGAILEVEAKLGQLVDKNRGERVRLPVLTECIISRDDPSMRIAFESSMTLAQHRSLNNFLNESVKSSMGPGSSRIPITYAHKKERDTFYEISSSALPPIVQHHLNPRHKPKVRVTTDQRTGAILARIIKCRIADLDVYSPRTNLDWRISVNLEMNYEGDINELIPASDAGNFGGRAKSRNKDRMSYRHLAYQIDLTQVATAEANNPPNPQADFEHELEIEISSAEIRRQGDLALAGDLANQYEELVKGFVDNVRVLARAVPGR
ncbi:mRNA capping enzyme, beta chain [Coccidioides immitis RS]|uniref:mRNA-capping enzyme subunit beta n=1 Tax=Coccidioides immitis (strain RS) TaxID=246410 RepID=J3K6D0_COCIM|nr:mRNA capping enzyme, beta chain [Coccidioides immitis RS]EAS30113.3 mRNA capping enzyme, beta chain [Coccidioides immitis RS]